MSFRPSLFDFFGILKPENINWHEGAKRTKIVLQGVVGAFVFMLALFDNVESYGKFYGFFVALFAVLGVYVGIEIVFRVSVWILKGFASPK